MRDNQDGDAVFNGSHDEGAGFGNSATSPALPKIRRTQTTMERVGRKKSRTYGSNTTLDDLGLHRSTCEGSWEKSMDAVDDAIDFLGEPKRKKRKSQRDLQTQGQSTLSSPKNSRAQNNSISEDNTQKQLVFGNFELRNALVFDGEDPKDSNSQVIMDNERLEGMSKSIVHHRQDLESPSKRNGNPVSEMPTALPSVVVVNGKPFSYLGKEVHQDEDELAGDGEEPARSTKTSKRKKRKQEDSSQQDRFDPWADDPDLPQENYKPRRSRFRGGDDGVDELIETIDFSKRPEAVAKNKRKSKISRRKTTGGAIVVHVDEEEEGSPFVEVEERSFEPVKSRSSKTPVRSIEVEEGPDEVVELEPDPPKRKRGRPKKEAGHTLASDAGTSVVEEPKPEGGPLSLSERSGKKKRKKRTLTPPDIDEDDDEATHDAGPTEEAKEASEAGPTSDFKPDAEERPSTPSPRKSKSQPLNDKTNINTASVLPAPDLSKPDAQTPEKKGKGPTRHSPISSSKVGYRIGLSRRARIEPLLRIVKK